MPSPLSDAPAAEPEPPSSQPQSTVPGLPRFRAAWPWVLCVVGLDYLSSLAYQPSVAFSVAGHLAPVVTLGVVAVTLFCAVPLYCYLAGRSPHGSGSAGLLEHLVPGWFGKFLVLLVLGFAATDLVFTRTFSAADAAEHMLHSPVAPWQSALKGATNGLEQSIDELPAEYQSDARPLANRHVVVTLVVLIVGSVVAWVFRRGVTRGLIRFAVIATLAYLTLSVFVIGSGLVVLAQRPDLIDNWWATIEAGTWKPGDVAQPLVGWWPLVVASIVLFPNLALGLSGYELALTSMPLVRGGRGEKSAEPRGRIRNTRLLLITAALGMSVLLLTSTLVTTILIPPEAQTADGQAANRALAYLAHGGPLAHGLNSGDVNPLFGWWLGAAYDLATVTVLTLAGITVIIGMRHLIPPYLYRLGMDYKWSQRWGLLMYLFVIVKLVVTYAYGANLEAQRGAYLTGVLSIFTAASLTAVIDVWTQRGSWAKVFLSPLFLLSLVVFAGSTYVVIRTQPAGLKMAAWFVGLTLGVSVVTRFFRNTELRFRGFEFADEQSQHLWQDMVVQDYPIIVPSRPGGESLAEKELDIRKLHRVPAEMAVVFLQVEIGDPSEFYSLPLLRVARENGRVVAHITRCASVPHVIAAAALEVSRYGVIPEVHFGWSNEHPLTANLNFVLFGHGNVPWMVYELIQAADFPAERKPHVMVG